MPRPTIMPRAARTRRVGSSTAVAATLVALLAGARAAAQPAPAAGGDVSPALERRLRALEESNVRLREQVEELRKTPEKQRVERLEKANAELREEVAKLREDHESLGEQVTKLLPLSGRISGYVDVGFFYVQGDGSGIRPDTGHQVFPEYSNVPDTWTFMGDPLSTTINSRGDVASTGPSRAVTFDPVHNGGKPSFIVNNFNLAVFAAAGDRLTMNGMIDFVPRGRDVSDPNGLFVGDYIDVKLAYAQYILPTRSFKMSLYVGKFDSVLGYEYRTQEAPDRLTITPSLMCRYTCGRPIGIKARGQFWRDTFVVNLAVTNGSNAIEGFPIYNEIAQNDLKTFSGRISTRAPVGAGLEVGVSGAFGAQDLQTSDSVYQYHMGVDAHLDWHDVDFTAEVMGGRASGKSEPGEPPCGVAPCLRYRGGYAQIGYRVFNWLTPYVRVDLRDALHQNGANFMYISQVVRGTGGLHFEIGENLVVKGEYTANRLYGKAPQFPHDVFTSSFVVKY